MKIFMSFTFLVSNFVFAGTIVGTKHDFSTQVWSQSEICITCHTPHNADTSNIDGPLWNHRMTTRTFTPYTSSTMRAATGQPDGASKLCLSCHDGSVAMDSYGGAVGTRFMGDRIGPNLLNGDGHWKHPLSIVYDTALSIADPRLNNPATTMTPLGSTIEKDLLFNGKVQCSSCHDVHNSKGLSDYLRISKSNLCKVCHKNGM